MFIILLVTHALAFVGGGVAGVLFYKNNQKKVATIVGVAGTVASAAQTVAKQVGK